MYALCSASACIAVDHTLWPHLQLVALLREVKYLRQRDSSRHAIPESAAAIYSKNETYRKFLQNLDVIVSLYNG